MSLATVVTAPGVVKSVTETSTVIKLDDSSYSERDIRTIRTEGKYLIISNDSSKSKRLEETTYTNDKTERRLCTSFFCLNGRPKLLTIVRLVALFFFISWYWSISWISYWKSQCSRWNCRCS